MSWLAGAVRKINQTVGIRAAYQLVDVTMTAKRTDKEVGGGGEMMQKGKKRGM
jgi:hypothetical protein